MADNLTPIGNRFNNNEITGSISKFMKDLADMQASEMSFEDALNRIKVSNVQNLGKLRKDQEQKVMEAALVAADKVVASEREKKLDLIGKELKQKIKNLKITDETERRAQVARLTQEAESKKKLAKDEAAIKSKYLKSQIALEAKERKKLVAEEAKAAAKKSFEQITGKGTTFKDRLEATKRLSKVDIFDAEGKKIGEGTNVAAGITRFADQLTSALSDFAKQLDRDIDTIAGRKSAIDTRLQGSRLKTNWAGSYWEQMSSDITGIAGISPLLKQSAIADRVSDYVSKGVAFNVEQRAVLQELAGKIATTFNATDSTLMRLVRIQQQDTTAGRLGMESALTAFLNNMYETTEYMSGVADQIRGNLDEAMSLMTGENALSFEYQIQKWLGSMYSVGMSQSSVSGLGGVLGKLAAGQLEAITSGGQGNLVIMAANQAGLSISDILNQGLTAETTNELMTSMVDYLAKIYKEAGNSKVIEQQIAQVFGMTASDLRAAVNLSKSTAAVSREGLTYGGAVGRLNTMASGMYARTSVGEMMTNAFENLKYTMAAGIANNPALYAMYKMSGMLENIAGGIAIPAISVAGSMVDLETTVADLMRVGALSGGILSGIGSMIQAGGGGGITGGGILKAAGIGKGISTVSRGSGPGILTKGGPTLSASGMYAANTEGSDVLSKTMTEAGDTSKSQLAEATAEATETKLSDVNSSLGDIYKLLTEIADGNRTMKVIVTEPVTISGTGFGGL